MIYYIKKKLYLQFIWSDAKATNIFLRDLILQIEDSSKFLHLYHRLYYCLVRYILFMTVLSNKYQGKNLKNNKHTLNILLLNQVRICSYSFSWERNLALALVTLTESCWARSTMDLRFLLLTPWAISAQNFLFCIIKTSNSYKFPKKINIIIILQ